MKLKIKFIIKKMDIFIIKILCFFSDKINKVKNDRDYKKIFIDYSFTNNTDLNTGIQRVVRNLSEQLLIQSKRYGFVSSNFILVEGFFISTENICFYNPSKYKTKFMHLTIKLINRLKLYGYIIQKNEKIQNGDILLMLDSTWHLNIWKNVEIAKKNGAIVIGVIYDLIPILFPIFCDDLLVKCFKEWIEKSEKYFDAYIGISQTVQKDVEKYINNQNSTNDSIFEYFYLGTDFNKQSDSKNVQKYLKDVFFKNKNTFLIVSTIEPRKNHRYLYEVFKKLWIEEIDVQLVIVGKIGWKVDSLISEMKSHNEFNKRLFLFHNLNDIELEYCYKNAKALVFPSYVEGYGLPIIESIQNNLPVLASDISIHREVGGDFIDYFDISDENSLLQKIKNSILTDKRDIQAMKIYSWKESTDNLLEKIIKIYDLKLITKGSKNV